MGGQPKNRKQRLIAQLKTTRLPLPDEYFEEVLSAISDGDLVKTLCSFRKATSAYEQVSCCRSLASSLKRSLARKEKYKDVQETMTLPMLKFCTRLLFCDSAKDLFGALIAVFDAAHSYVPCVVEAPFQEVLSIIKKQMEDCLRENVSLTTQIAMNDVIRLQALLPCKLAMENRDRLPLVEYTRFLSKCVEDIARECGQTLEDTSNEDAEGGSLDDDHTQTLIMCLKMIFSLLTAPAGNDEDKSYLSEEDRRQLERISMSLLRVPSTPRDAVTAAALVYTQNRLLDCEGRDYRQIAEAFYLFGFGSNIAEEEYSKQSDKAEQTLTSLPPYSRLACYRALLNCLPTAVLTKPLNEFKGGNLLLHGLFERISSFVDGNSDQRLWCYTFQAAEKCADRIKAVVGDGKISEDRVFRSREEVISFFNKGVDMVITHCEDPFTGITDQMQNIFGSVLDIYEMTKSASSPREQSSQGGLSGIDSVISQAVTRLLGLDDQRKGKYRLLTCLLKRYSSTMLLRTRSDFLDKLLLNMKSNTVSPSIGSFFESILKDLLLSSQSHDEWCSYWVPAMARAMLSEDERVRNNVVLYGLGRAIIMRPLVLVDMLRALKNAENKDSTYRSFAIIALLRVAREESLFDFFCAGRDDSAARELLETMQLSDENGRKKVRNFVSASVSVEDIEKALLDGDEYLRLNALRLICTSRKVGEELSAAEIHLLEIFLKFNMKSNSSYYRQTAIENLQRAFTRVRLSTTRILKAAAEGKQTPDDKEQQQRVAEFMQRTVQFLLRSLFSGGSYVRRIMALDLLRVIFDVFFTENEFYSPLAAHGASGENPDKYVRSTKKDVTRRGDKLALSSFPLEAVGLAELISPSSTILLLNCLVDSFDEVRELSFRLLLHFPSPLPFSGDDADAFVRTLLRWGKQLILSPRVRENDAGVLLLRLLLNKYSATLGWKLSVSRCSIEVEEGPISGEQAVIYFVLDSLSFIRERVKLAREDIIGAASEGFAHGALQLFRTVIMDIQPRLFVNEHNAALWKNTVEEAFLVAKEVAAIGLHAMSDGPPEKLGSLKDELPSNSGISSRTMHTTIDDVDLFPTISSKLPESLDMEHVPEKDEASPPEQVIVVASWLSVKESSLMLGDLVQVFLPLSLQQRDEPLISPKTVVEIGDWLVGVVMSTLHRGAMEKSSQGLELVSRRLLLSSDTELASIPAKWLSSIIVKLASGDTTTTRRSAGLPYVFLALLHGEPSDKPRLLLDATIRELLTIASGEQGLPPKQESADELALSGSHTLGVTHIRGSSRTGDLKKSLPSAIDAVHNEVARVHALNVLRHIFRDSVFSLSLFPHIGDAVRCSCDGLKAKSWGIVNASTMLFAALVQRVVGSKRVRDEHSSANGITTFEFFSRFPSLHGFFFEALKEATADLQQQEQGELDVLSGSQRIHPGLQPVLVLLSRLQAPPSEIPNDPLAIGGFFPLISLCSRLRQYHGRTMAARALLSTIPGDRVDRCFRSLLETIPSDPSKCLKALGHNGVHGVLLQLASIARAHPFKEQIRPDHALSELVNDIGYLRTCRFIDCPPVRAAFLELCAALTDLFQSTESEKRSWHMLAVASDASTSANTLRDCVGGPKMREVLAIAQVSSCLRDVLNSSSFSDSIVSARDLLCRLLAHKQIEIRLGCLKQLKRAILSSGASDQLRKLYCSEGVQFALLNVIKSSKPGSRECRKALRIALSASDSGLSADGLLVFSSEGFSAVQRHLDDRIRGSRVYNLPLVERALPFSGEALRQGNLLEDVGVWERFVRWCESCALPAKPSELRYAAVEALRRSSICSLPVRVAEHSRDRGLSDESKGRLFAASARSWTSLCLLLEDDDEDVRTMAAKTASDALRATSMASSDLLVAKALESAYEGCARLFFASTFESSALNDAQNVIVGHLLSVLCKHDGPLQSLIEVLSRQSMTRRLFEKEVDNFHAEEFTTARLASRALQIVWRSFADRAGDLETSFPSISKEEWKTQLYNDLDYLRTKIAGPSGSSSVAEGVETVSLEWMGNVSYHPDVFAELGRRIYSVVALSTQEERLEMAARLASVPGLHPQLQQALLSMEID